MESLIEQRNTKAQASYTGKILTFTNRYNSANVKTEWRYITKADVEIDTPNQDGNPCIRARRLHPTFYGHEAIARIISGKHKKDVPIIEQSKDKSPSAPTKMLHTIPEWDMPSTLEASIMKWLFYETKVGESVVCKKLDYN